VPKKKLKKSGGGGKGGGEPTLRGGYWPLRAKRIKENVPLKVVVYEWQKIRALRGRSFTEEEEGDRGGRVTYPPYRCGVRL